MHLDPADLPQLIGLLMVLVIWIAASRGERRWSRGFKAWEAERREQREAEAREAGRKAGLPTDEDRPRGPWG